jgi:nucleoside-diphosphate-sugar epimerase
MISTTMLRVASPFHRISKETLGILYQWTNPFVVDDSRFRDTFGPVEVTPLDEAVRTSVDWYRTGAGPHA